MAFNAVRFHQRRNFARNLRASGRGKNSRKRQQGGEEGEAGFHVSDSYQQTKTICSEGRRHVPSADRQEVSRRRQRSESRWIRVGHIDQLPKAESPVGIAPMHRPQRPHDVAGARGIALAMEQPPGNRVFQRVAESIRVLLERALPSRGGCGGEIPIQSCAANRGSPARTWRRATGSGSSPARWWNPQATHGWDSRAGI